MSAVEGVSLAAVAEQFGREWRERVSHEALLVQGGRYRAAARTQPFDLFWG